MIKNNRRKKLLDIIIIEYIYSWLQLISFTNEKRRGFENILKNLSDIVLFVSSIDII